MFLFAIIYRQWNRMGDLEIGCSLACMCTADNINNNEMSMAISVLAMSIGDQLFLCMVKLDEEREREREKKYLIEKTYPFHCCYHVEHDNHYWYLPYQPLLVDLYLEYLYLTKNVSIVYHHYELNDENVVDDL